MLTIPNIDMIDDDGFHLDVQSNLKSNEWNLQTPIETRNEHVSSLFVFIVTNL